MSDATPDKSPKTARGEKARARLVEAARVVFERDGFLETRLADVAREAGTTAGSVYTYFTNKEEMFHAVLDQVQAEMLHPSLDEYAEIDDPVQAIATTNRAYLDSYRRNASMMQLLEQVATIDATFRGSYTVRLDAFSRRNARSIRDLQARGLADPELDPLLAANALANMVSRTAYDCWVFGRDWDATELADTLTRLWANALRLNPGATQLQHAGEGGRSPEHAQHGRKADD